ncbi:hypothetical protein HY489_02685 [Candidatus Woesearchaeota archaeon]|nr:hypothetical protein [Candidatus Woesearchaeota archaeon]
MEFDEYFLNAQRDGNEVYLGEDIVLVVYENGGIALQTQHPTFYFNGVFCDAEFIPGSDLEQRLNELRRPENRQGIKSELTNRLRQLWNIVQSWHEDNDPGMDFDILGRYNPCRFKGKPK